MTPLQELRLDYQPELPEVLQEITQLAGVSGGDVDAITELAEHFAITNGQPVLKFASRKGLQHQPLKVGVVLSGGQAAGGHNVIAGLYDALQKLNTGSVLYGFLNGPSGIVNNDHIEITADQLAHYRNQGGFDLIGSGRTKIETSGQFKAAHQTAEALDLDGIVIIGGDDSNTNAALLAEYFLEQECKTCVVGVPKTIDGDLKNEDIEVSFGFDTATKTYSEVIGNILRDALSAKKYYFFIKLMGRSASHVALECALQTHPNMTLIGEEIEAKNQTFHQLTSEICDMICARAKQGKNFGAVLIPEGVIEFIPEFKRLIQELNGLDIESKEDKKSFVLEELSPESKQCFESIPGAIQMQLLLDRDPHGNVQVSKIETERLFIEAVKVELSKRGDVEKFSAQPLFCGYEGRSCLPSNFDAQYCYALGHVAALLIDVGVTGYMACVRDLARPTNEWQIAGIPIVSMMTIEKRRGVLKPVIKKALVDLEGAPFAFFQKERKVWALEDHYRYPGPIQFYGPESIKDSKTRTLLYENLVPRFTTDPTELTEKI